MLPALIPPRTAARSPSQVLTEIASERHRRDFELFAQRAWHIIEPKRCVWNWHMSAIAEHLVYVTQGEIRNLMINIPPRMTKSLLTSVLWPVWDWLHNPGRQFICASYDLKLALRDAVLSRRLIESAWFQNQYAAEFFLLADENQKQMYRNSEGGYRITTSVNGASTGYGGDIQCLDDPHNAKKVESDTDRHNALTWHDNAWRSRMNDPNKTQKVYTGQRTHDVDIFGHVMEMEGKRWVRLELPMEFDAKRVCITFPNKGRGVQPGAKQIFKDPRKLDGELLNPKRFNKFTAAEEREAMSRRAWDAQYQQQPEGQGGLILKRHWWKQWVWPDWHAEAGKDRPLPEFMEIIQVYDTAFEEDEEADFSARTTWGMFHYRESILDEKTGRLREGKQRICALLLDMMEERLEYPELRKEALDSNEDFAPDQILIEKKASGHSLIQELRKKGLPIKAVKLTDGGDLTARVHAASLMLEKGCIYYIPRRWAQRVIEQGAKFPNADHDDIVATLAIAWMYMRRFYDLSLPDDDEQHEISPWKWKRKSGYG